MNKKQCWFNLQNATQQEATLSIFDEIGGWGTTANELMAELDQVTAATLHVELFSPGGYIDEGVQIYNALRKHPARVVVHIDSLAASIASVIAMAGDEIHMAENAMMMIHDPWSGVMGNADDMRKQADVLDKLKASIVLTYAKRTGMNSSEIESLMTEETWMSAADAFEKGFIDVVDSLVEEPAQASFSGRIVNAFQSIPEGFKDALSSLNGSNNPCPQLMLSPSCMAQSFAQANAKGAQPENKRTQKTEVVMKDDNESAPKELNAARDSAVQAERKRTQDIEAIATRAKDLLRGGEDKLARDAVASGETVADFQAKVLDALHEKAKNQQSPLGMTDHEAGSFSFQRLMYAAATNDWKNAGFERETCAATAQKIGKNQSGYMVPTDVISRPANVVTSTVGAPTIQTDVLAQSFIELLRAKMKVRSMGATVLGGLNGNISIPRQTAGATAFWVAEGAQPTLTDQTFDAVTLSPKGVAGITQTTIQNLMQSSLDMEAFIRADLAKVIALALDLAAISGTGAGNQPLGILNTAGVGSVAMGVNGAALTDVNPFVNLETLVADSDADGDSMGYLTNARVVGALKTLRSTTGEYLFHNPINDAPGAVASVNGYNVTRSNQVSKTGAKGTGAGLSSVLFGNWSDLIIGEWGALNLQVDPFTAGVGNIKVNALQFVDCGVRHPASFAAITDIIA